MKTLMLAVVLAFSLPSCVSYKDLTKKEPVSQSLLSRLKPDKRYKFKLKIGQTQVIRITSVDTSRVTGYVYQRDAKRKKFPYSESFENVENHVAKIKVRKFRPILTGALILSIPLSAFIYLNTGSLDVGF